MKGDNIPEGVSSFELEGTMVIRVYLPEDLDYILENYDLVLVRPLWGTTDRFILDAKNPKKAARIMYNLRREDLVKWAEFNFWGELIWC